MVHALALLDGVSPHGLRVGARAAGRGLGLKIQNLAKVWKWFFIRMFCQKLKMMFFPRREPQV